jgi:chemotaxis protein MotB
MATLALALTAGGCVSKKTFDAKALEASQLDRSLQELTATHTRLQQDADRLRDRNGDLDRQLLAMTNRSEILDADLQRARNDIERLEKVLSERSSEAGVAMAEMRRTIDRIEAENRELAAQVEMERVAREARIAHLQSTYDELMDKMQGEISRGEVTISELKGKLTVNLVERILFDSGKADLKPAGLEVLKRVGDILRQETDKEVRVEGHTDNVPVSPRLQDTFPSNWELSTARASNVVRFLQDRVGIPGERLSSCGFGQYRPLADNATAAGRAENRRIQIVLVPLEAQAVAKPE